jgi:hypothetical protein
MGQATEEGPIAGAVTPTPAPAMAATTLDQIKQIRTVRAAKEIIQASSPAFQALVPRAITAVYDTDPHQWWDQTTKVDAWREVLEYAVELADQQQHEKSAAGQSPRPAADPTSGPGRAERPIGNHGEGRDSAMTPGSDNLDDGGGS